MIYVRKQYDLVDNFDNSALFITVYRDAGVLFEIICTARTFLM